MTKKDLTMQARNRWIPLLLLCLVAAGTAQADSEKKGNREREALRRVQLQLQQMQGQVSTLEQEKTQLSQDLDKAASEAKKATGRAARLSRDLKAERSKRENLEKTLEQANKDLASHRERLAQTEQQLAETRSTLAKTSQTLSITEGDKRRLEGIKASQEREIASCESKNLKLYQTGRDLMTRFEQKTCNEVMAQKEPLFGLKRVEIENLLEEYRDKLDEQKLIKAPGS